MALSLLFLAPHHALGVFHLFVQHPLQPTPHTTTSSSPNFVNQPVFDLQIGSSSGACLQCLVVGASLCRPTRVLGPKSLLVCMGEASWGARAPTSGCWMPSSSPVPGCLGSHLGVLGVLRPCSGSLGVTELLDLKGSFSPSAPCLAVFLLFWPPNLEDRPCPNLPEPSRNQPGTSREPRPPLLRSSGTFRNSPGTDPPPCPRLLALWRAAARTTLETEARRAATLCMCIRFSL